MRRVLKARYGVLDVAFPQTQQLLALLKELGGHAEDAKTALEMLISMREEARKNKDYAKGDLIRSRLKELGITIEDKPDGTRWKLD